VSLREAGPGDGTGPATWAPASRTLPRDTAGFTGRGGELARMTAAAADARGVVGIQAIGGMAGIGKTALAVHAAHQLASRFPGGQLFVALHGHTPGYRPVDPADALAGLLVTAGVSPARIPSGLPERAALWRDHLAGQRVLLVLDDAVGTEQVEPLLPGAAGSLVLVTSRRHLTGLTDQARACYRRPLELARVTHCSWAEGCALTGLGLCARAAGRRPEARDLLREAHEIFLRIGAAEADGAAAELDALART